MNCQDCGFYKFRVVSMVLNVKDAGHQCHHDLFQQNNSSTEDLLIVQPFRKIENPNNTPDWCPLRRNL